MENDATLALPDPEPFNFTFNPKLKGRIIESEFGDQEKPEEIRTSKSSRPNTPNIVGIPRTSEDLSGSFFLESDIHEDIPIELSFENGEQEKIELKIGETVQKIKKIIEKTHGIPYSEISLYLDGSRMMDPLSLNDFPSILKDKQALIEVKTKTSRIISEIPVSSEKKIQENTQGDRGPINNEEKDNTVSLIVDINNETTTYPPSPRTLMLQEDTNNNTSFFSRICSIL